MMGVDFGALSSNTPVGASLLTPFSRKRSLSGFPSTPTPTSGSTNSMFRPLPMHTDVSSMLEPFGKHALFFLPFASRCCFHVLVFLLVLFHKDVLSFSSFCS